MKKINMRSGNFSHVSSSTLYKKSESIEWDFNSKDNHSSFYIDGDVLKGIHEAGDGKRKFLWGLESRHFNQGFAGIVRDNLGLVLNTFEAIFTYDDNLIKLSPKFKWAPAMGTWIDEPLDHDKTKLVSMVTSGKTHTEQQKFRVNFANNHQDKIDLFGGINPDRRIERKDVALNDYMFSIAIENDTSDTYFTEKILDCFATATIPVYKGTKNVCRYFNPDGIIFIDGDILPDLSYDLYQSKREAVLENLQKVKEFNTIEDWIYLNYAGILK
jgi:hypothetical protein